MAAPLFSNGEQVGEHVTLLLRCADTVEHIVAIALEPFCCFARVSESLRIGRRRKRLYDFAGLGMFALRSRIVGMAGSATPFVGMLCLEKAFPARRRELLQTGHACRFLLNCSQYLAGRFRESRLRR